MRDWMNAVLSNLPIFTNRHGKPFVLSIFNALNDAVLKMQLRGGSGELIEEDEVLDVVVVHAVEDQKQTAIA
ncbi:MAG: hypothetical protein RL092_1225 [Bacteroidota bacterium]|jgi:hypothetical protein